MQESLRLYQNLKNPALINYSVYLRNDLEQSDDIERQKNLKLFRAWVGNWTLKRFPDLTKKDLTGIKLIY